MRRIKKHLSKKKNIIITKYFSACNKWRALACDRRSMFIYYVEILHVNGGSYDIVV